MKTIKSINSIIEAIREDHRRENEKKGVHKLLKGKVKESIEELKKAATYLETTTEEQVKKQLEDTSKGIKILCNRFELWRNGLTSSELQKAGNCLKKQVTYYEKKFRVPQLRAQVRMLKFLLSD